MKPPPKRSRAASFDPSSRLPSDTSVAPKRNALPDEDTPTTLERTLMRTREGEVPISTLIWELTRTELLLPSGSEVKADESGLDPVLFMKDDVPMVACFTAAGRLGSVTSIALYGLQVRGSDLLRRIPPGHGLVINPRHELWFDLSPEGVALAVSELS